MVQTSITDMPMGDIDNRTLQLFSEEDLLLNDIFQGDHELMFLDTYLTDIFKFKA